MPKSSQNDLTGIIIDAAVKIHSRLGPGLFENVYEVCLAYELRNRGLYVARQVPISMVYDSIRFDEGFKADLIVNDAVIIELKSIETLLPVHKKQLLTYLKLAGKQIGHLLNFGAPLMKDGIVRVVNGLPE